MRKVIISTGWYAENVPERNRTVKNEGVSKRLFDRDYLINIWRPYILRFIQPAGFLVYLSGDVYPRTQPMDMEFILSRRPKDQNKHNDHAASMLMGAYYAYLNECDFMYIEQDCLVYGLDRALESVQDKSICFGGGEFECSQGWAENSFVYVSYNFIPEFIERQNDIKFHAFKDGEYRQTPEITFNDLYAGFAHWPFGYGRKRPIDFNQKVFYAQKLTDPELDEFLRKV